mmetsp:Transcript_3490/g.9807  ORF Transcript_3490/g.9807 Transcript_3490/m.9807 type:complete len:264 (+) Transcript_3490:1001-1792(+)
MGNVRGMRFQQGVRPGIHRPLHLGLLAQHQIVLQLDLHPVPDSQVSFQPPLLLVDFPSDHLKLVRLNQLHLLEEVAVPRRARLNHLAPKLWGEALPRLPQWVQLQVDFELFQGAHPVQSLGGGHLVTAARVVVVREDEHPLLDVVLFGVLLEHVAASPQRELQGQSPVVFAPRVAQVLHSLKGLRHVPDVPSGQAAQLLKDVHVVQAILVALAVRSIQNDGDLVVGRLDDTRLEKVLQAGPHVLDTSLTRRQNLVHHVLPHVH